MCIGLRARRFIFTNLENQMTESVEHCVVDYRLPLIFSLQIYYEDRRPDLTLSEAIEKVGYKYRSTKMVY